MYLIVFEIDKQLMAFDLSNIERAVLAVEITPMPTSTKPVMGAINVRGEIIPVINLRHVLGFPEKDMDVNDHFMICTYNSHRVALWLDRVVRITSCQETELMPAEQMYPGLKCIASVMREDGEIIIVYQLNHLLPFVENAKSLL